MTSHALITGALYRDPERRTSKAGKPFVTGTVRVRDGDGSTFWRVTIFSESAGEEMLRLKAGDAVSVQGAMKAELWTPEGGEPKISLSLIAEMVLALRQPARSAGEKRGQGARNDAARYRGGSTGTRPARDSGSALAKHAGTGVDHFGDETPF